MSDTQVVTFNYQGWATRYPEFSQTVGASLAQSLFNEATLYIDNTPCSLVWDIPQRTTLLNMLVAHLAALNFGTNGNAASSLVGRISSATEGSVSVSTDMGVPGNATQAWFQQTKYGAAFWQATLQYRVGGRYRQGPVPYLGVNRGGYGRGYGGGFGRY